jgi:hypothetical protein
MASLPQAIAYEQVTTAWYGGGSLGFSRFTGSFDLATPAVPAGSTIIDSQLRAFQGNVQPKKDGPSKTAEDIEPKPRAITFEDV